MNCYVTNLKCCKLWSELPKTPSRPDSMKAPRPWQLLVFMNSVEGSNKACIVGVKNIHELLFFVNDLSNNNSDSK